MYWISCFLNCVNAKSRHGSLWLAEKMFLMDCLVGAGGNAGFRIGVGKHWFACKIAPLLVDIQSPIWFRIPWPVSNSVPRPITNPIIARRPFQVSANSTKPKREAVWSDMILWKWEFDCVCEGRLLSQQRQRCCGVLEGSSLALDQVSLLLALWHAHTFDLRLTQPLPSLWQQGPSCGFRLTSWKA